MQSTLSRPVRTSVLVLALAAAALAHAGECYAGGGPATAKKGTVGGPAIKLITSFEERNPFHAGTVVGEHATHGTKALRIDRGFVGMDAAQNWAGYDYLKADVYTDADRPLELYVEVRDRQTRDY